MQGTLDFVKGRYNTASLPELHGTFEYGNRKLTTNATAVDSSGRRLAVVNGTIPINLALSGVTGPRLLDAPIDVRLQADSLPLALIPNFTATVTDVAGTAHGERDDRRHAQEARSARLRSRSPTRRLGSPRRAPTSRTCNGSVRMSGDSVYVDSIAGSSNGRCDWPARSGSAIGASRRST